jgi:hypothetical protein
MTMLQGGGRVETVVALPARPPDPELIRVREEERGRMLTLLDDESASKAIKPSAKSHQQVRIVSFEC